MSFKLRKVCLTLCLGVTISSLAMADEEPDIQIRPGKNETFYEYRVNGELVEIKVVPKIGPTYYLIPSQGGEFERSDSSRLVFPTWKLLEW